MSLIKQQEHATLKQVQKELENALLKTQRLLESFSEDKKNLTLLQDCRVIMHEVQGVLIVVELYGASSLAEEMVAVIDEVLEGKATRINDVIEALMMAVVKLPDYLEKIVSGAPDGAIYLLPALNDLRAAIDAPLLSETAIFAPNLDEKIKQLAHTTEINPELQQIVKKFRTQYHKGLLLWYVQNDIKNGVGSLKTVISSYINESNSELSQYFLQAVHALSIGLIKGQLDSGVALKKIFGAIDRALRPIISDGEAALSESISLDLWRNILFYLSTVEEPGYEFEQDVKGLVEKGLLVKQSDAEAHDFAGQSMLEGVQKALLEDIMVIIDELDLFIRSDRTDKQKVKALASPLSRMGDTLTIVGRGALSTRLKHISEQAETVSENITEENLLSLAGELLFVQSSISGMAEQQDSDDDESLALSLPKGELRAHFDVAISEVNVTLARIKENITNYLFRLDDASVLNPVPEYLSQVAGALFVLEFEQASPLLMGLSDYIESDLLTEKTVLDPKSSDILADVVSGVEYFIETAMLGGGGLDDILTSTENALAELKSYTTIEDVETAAEETADSQDEVEIEIDPEILEIFVEEANEELAAIREYYPRWKQSSEDIDALSRIRRSFHTLKGSGRMVGATVIGEFSWAIENLLNRIIDKTVERSPKVIDLLDEATLALVGLIDAQTQQTETDVNWQEIQKTALELAGSHHQVTEVSSEAVKKNDEINDIEDLGLNEEILAESKLIQLESDLDPEILEIFIEEAREELEVLKDYFPRWRENNQDADSLARIRRSFHTLKGSGRMVGANSIGEFAWSVEKLFNRIIDGTISSSEKINQSIAKSIDILPDFVDALEHATPLKYEYQPLQAVNFALAEGKDVEIPTIGEISTINESIEIIPEPEPEEEVEEIEENDIPTESLTIDTYMPSESVVAMALDQDLDPEILEIFIEEAQEEIIVLNEYFPRWIENTNDQDSLAIIRRSFHTLKGSGRMVGANTIGEFAWSVEKMFNQMMDDKITINSQIKKALTESVAIIPSFVYALEHEEPLSFNYLPLQEANFSLAAGENIDPPSLLIPKEGESVSVETTISSEVSSLFDEVEAAESEAVDLDLNQLEFKEQAELQDSQFAASEFIDNETKSSDFVESHFGIEMDTVLYDIFLSESLTHIKTIKEFIESCQECYVEDEVCRAFHTLRGSAHMAEVPSVAELAGSVEHYLNSLNAQNTVIKDEVRDVIGNCVRNIEQDVLSIGSNQPTSDNWKTLADQINGYHEAFIHASVESAEAHDDGNVQEEAEGIDPEMVEIFLEEAADLLDTLDDSLQAWLAEPTDFSHIDSMKRTLHTLKGGARLSGVTSLGDLSHNFETLLTDIADQKIEISDEITELSQDVGDGIADLVDQVAMSQVPVVADELLNRLNTALGEEGADSNQVDSSSLLNNSSLDDSSLLDSSVSNLQIDTASQDSNISSDTGLSDFPESKLSFHQSKKKAKEKEQKKSADSGEKVRVSADLLDKLVNLSGEVSIYRARLEQQNISLQFNLTELEQTVTRLRKQLRTLEIETEAQILFRHEREDEHEEEALGDNDDFDPLEMDRFSTMQQVSRSLAETVSDLGSIRDLLEEQTKEADILLLQQFRVSTDLQDGLLRTRMVPFNQVVSRLSRLVRQTARSLKKESELNVIGQDTEVDRGILQRIVGPLEHLLRNAVSHGIETPKDRKAKNKKIEGQITIELSREGRDVLIAVSDDGGGLNREKILAKAVEKEMVKANAKLTDEDIYQFIAKPGFSTVEQLDQISGRGVGMDVVFSEIKELGGSVEIQSKLGQGSIFTIRLPLTLSITDALLVTVAEERYAILHTSIEGVVRLPQEQLLRIQEGGDEVYEYAGQAYNIRILARMLGLASKPQKQAAKKWVPALLVKAGRRRVALQVDSLLGNRQVVVKPVGLQIGTVPWISGGSILGDGGVALLLDVNALIHTDLTNRDSVKELVEEKVTTIMVVDDSITVRKVTTRVLERYDMNVITAKDGLDALEVLGNLQDQIPDVMLLDIEMPRMDGFELAKRIMSNGKYQQIPIIMITSRTGDKHRERALGIGVKRYLGKPFQEAELMDNIKSVLADAEK